VTARIGYRSIALLRIVDFDARPPAVRPELQDRLAGLTRASLAEAGLPAERHRLFPGPDHLLVMANHSPFGMITDFVRCLDVLMHESEPRFRPEHTLRLVAALGHGLVARRDGYPADQVVRQCDRLAREPAVEARTATLVVVVADAFHRDVVLPGHRGIDPSDYEPLPYSGERAWIRVLRGHAPPGPAPSGNRRLTLPEAHAILRELGGPDR
jgi:hypothetical protein